MAPTIVVTAVAGLFGLIPASIAANRARAQASSGRDYWQAFGITLTAVTLGWVVTGAAVAVWLLGSGKIPDRTVASPTVSPTRTHAATSRPAATPTAPATAPRAPATHPPAAATIPPGSNPMPPTAPANPRTTRTAAQPGGPGSHWPAYSYFGPANLCTTPAFPEPALIRVGSGFTPATQSAEYALVALGYDGVDRDGVLDAQDGAALTRFQRNHGLVADGTLGQQSWTQLRTRLLHYDKC